LAGIRIGEGTSVCGGVKFYGGGKISIGCNCWLGIGTKFYISINSSLVIEDNVDIAPDVIFHTGTHHIGPASRRAGHGESKNICVGAGTWIGVRSVVLAGVVIPPGCIVGAGSTVVDKTFSANSLLAGSPASIKRSLQ